MYEVTVSFSNIIFVSLHTYFPKFTHLTFLSFVVANTVDPTQTDPKGAFYQGIYFLLFHLHYLEAPPPN